MKKVLPLRLFLYLGFSVYIIGALFRIQHWPNGRLLLQVSIVFELIFSILVSIDILMSKKAAVTTKTFWMTSCFLALAIALFVPFGAILYVILGIVYLRKGRPKFLYVPEKNDHIHFDSI